MARNLNGEGFSSNFKRDASFSWRKRVKREKKGFGGTKIRGICTPLPNTMKMKPQRNGYAVLLGRWDPKPLCRGFPVSEQGPEATEHSPMSEGRVHGAVIHVDSGPGTTWAPSYPHLTVLLHCLTPEPWSWEPLGSSKKD